MGRISKMKKKIKLNFLDCDDNIIDILEVNELNVSENYILKKSRIDYDNEEPCIIIRTSIMGDLFNEFNKYLKMKIKEKNIILIDNLPELYRESINFGDKTQKLYIQEI